MNTVEAYEAARLAYEVLYPGSSERDWEDWLGRTEEQSQNGTDDTDALARLCEVCALSGNLDRDPSLLSRVSRAAGFFQGTSAAIDELAHDNTIQVVA